ncbi:TrkA family potassium uptake protein [Salicibibacter cibarius]|uniref:Trk system potassium uptake protein TrkA n=2 Tax=Bacillaceae TaxID=186817 RepID=A0A1G8Q0I7_9BACI|nr:MULTISPECIES: TrkA family potassium uptake protein [Bacillaceae]QQK75432.1 TrkA family potassium uptake protein [Salicibibacter cibarius]SDI98207.1 trk system potassium uptake protein TrkA [Natribacillus halophilus]
MRNQFVVIGLGRFGQSVTKTLIDNENDVLAIDKDEQIVQEVAPKVTHAVQVDATDESALEQLGLHKFSHAIVGIGENLQASILTTLILKELNVGEVTAKAKDDYHGKVLSKIGADNIVFPERDMGDRLGNLLSSSNLIDYLELSSEYNMVEIRAPKAMDGCTLQKLNINKTYGCIVMAIKDKDEEVNISPHIEDHIHHGDILTIIGKHKDIRRLQKDYREKSRLK